MTNRGATVPIGGHKAGWIGLVLLLALAAGLRIFGLDWDEGQLFHPDERRIILALQELSAPTLSQWRSLLGPESPLNPHFFSYGSFPIYLLKGTVGLLSLGWKSAMEYRSMALLGRTFSIASDLVTVGLAYLLGKRLYGLGGGLMASLLVALSVLHIQLAHFYTVDTLLACFILLALAAALRVSRTGSFRWGASAGCARPSVTSTSWSRRSTLRKSPRR